MLEESEHHQTKSKTSANEVDPFLVESIERPTLLNVNNAYLFWTETLGSARHILAPMVDQSELAFRLMVRDYDVHCTYSPMYNSNVFVRDPKYQRECLQVLPESDTPLIIQFCANKPETFLQSAKIAAPYCTAIDLNLGCPQTIARRGHYGAFLQDEWNLIYDIVNLAARQSPKPITCKIRVYKDINKTVQYAKMVESAGASLITVHGRVREQKGPLTGLADWNHIRAVKENVRIPVFANGNIQSKGEVEKCFQETKVDGVMSAEGLLYNPALFTGKPLPVWEAASQYVHLARKHPRPFSYIRGHVFKFFHHCFMLEEHRELRDIVSKTHKYDDLLMVAEKLKEYYSNEYETFVAEGKIPDHPKELPVFFCKPYYRPAPTLFNSKPNSQNYIPNQLCDKSESMLQIDNPCKKRKKEPKSKPKNVRRIPLSLCVKCPNPRGIKCDFDFCRTCCKMKAFKEKIPCHGHRFGLKKPK